MSSTYFHENVILIALNDSLSLSLSLSLVYSDTIFKKLLHVFILQVSYSN